MPPDDEFFRPETELTAEDLNRTMAAVRNLHLQSISERDFRHLGTVVIETLQRAYPWICWWTPVAYLLSWFSSVSIGRFDVSGWNGNLESYAVSFYFAFVFFLFGACLMLALHRQLFRPAAWRAWQPLPNAAAKALPPEIRFTSAGVSEWRPMQDATMPRWFQAMIVGGLPLCERETGIDSRRWFGRRLYTPLPRPAGGSLPVTYRALALTMAAPLLDIVGGAILVHMTIAHAASAENGDLRKYLALALLSVFATINTLAISAWLSPYSIQVSQSALR